MRHTSSGLLVAFHYEQPFVAVAAVVSTTVCLAFAVQHLHGLLLGQGPSHAVSQLAVVSVGLFVSSNALALVTCACWVLLPCRRVLPVVILWLAVSVVSLSVALHVVRGAFVLEVLFVTVIAVASYAAATYQLWYEHKEEMAQAQSRTVRSRQTSRLPN